MTISRPLNMGVSALYLLLFLTLHGAGYSVEILNGTSRTLSPMTHSSLFNASISLVHVSMTDAAEWRLQSELSAADSCTTVMSSLASHVPKEVCHSYYGDKSTNCYVYTSHAYPESFLPPRQCCGSCSIQASHVRVNFWASQPGITTSPQSPYTLVSDGYTFTSPSVYVVLSGLYARAECTMYGDGQIGNNISVATIAYPPDALSTARCYQEGDGGFNGWKTIDYEDWQDPAPNSIAAIHSSCHLLGTATLFDPAGTDLIASPQFSIPQDVSTLQPLWQEYGCRPWRYGAFDPPRTLTRADAMAPDPHTSAVMTSSATPGAQVAPPIVSPTATNPRKTTSAAISQDPKDPHSDPALESDSKLQGPKPAPESKPPSNSQASDVANRGPSAAPQDPKYPQESPASGTVVNNPQDPDRKPSNMVYASEAAKDDHLKASFKSDLAPQDPAANGHYTDGSSFPPTPTKQDQDLGPGTSPMTEEHPPNFQQPKVIPVSTTGSETWQYHADPATNINNDSHTVVTDGPAISSSGDQANLASFAKSGIASFAIGNEIITPNSASKYIIQGQTLTPGAPAVMVSGTPFSLAPSAAHIAVGSDTIRPLNPEVSAITPGDQVITPDSARNFVIGSQTILELYTTQAIIDGSTVALLALPSPTSTTAVDNGQTITAVSASPFNPSIGIPPPSQSILTIGSQALPYIIDKSGEYVIVSQTLKPGGTPVTISGMTVFQASDSPNIVVASGSSTTSEGLRGIINGALGRTDAPSSEGVSPSFKGGVFTGGTIKGNEHEGFWRSIWVVLAACGLAWLW